MSNSLYQDQARFFVRSYLGPDCLQKLSADETSRQRGKENNQIGLSVHVTLIFTHRNSVAVKPFVY